MNALLGVQSGPVVTGGRLQVQGGPVVTGGRLWVRVVLWSLVVGWGYRGLDRFSVMGDMPHFTQIGTQRFDFLVQHLGSPDSALHS